ncbi:VapE domain-containing protein [uncultured Oscillibacter sp.]|uniref:VapE domain-containing protein n=1 Tax=uncultured Oscillibacter sp. TaxID=876091 RepID=UPI0025F0C65F|nr:VapE domain-containing protein [uncultured Oscillibacter sp.]
MMINDRKIIISAGASRLAKVWTRQTLLLSELYTRLATPARGTETLETYLSLPKNQQDALKDVGGFVGGALNGPRRKAGAVAGRDILTLDLDHVPAGGTADVLRRVEALGCGYCVYSTRKHSPAAPRLRVILPLDRTATADEYEACARKLADMIGIDMADPSTFEPSRLMYWPSCCADSEYIYQVGDKHLLSTNGVLGLYDDWHNVASWPQVPGADKAPKRLATRQGDPEEKQGAIGAFCRTYDVLQAVDKFLPGVYEPVPGFDDRYTYTGGSTTGGAIIYDGGKFLFSHHATDPCGGRLVNSFDLVRLHKFGNQDDDAAPGTFTNQLPSYKTMLDLCKRDASVSDLLNKENGERILEAFQKTETGNPVTGNDAELAMFLGGLKGEVLTTDVVRRLMELLGIQIKLNEVTWHVELSGYPKTWSRANAENLLPVRLLDHLRLAGIKGAAKNTVADCLDVIAEENRFNPVTDMFQSAQWDGTDRVPELYDVWGVSDTLSRTLIRKWLLQCVAMAYNDEYNPQGADGILVLQGDQGVGKTSALRQLVPLPRMFKEGAKLDLRVKDTYMQALNAWICELGELDRTTARDSAGLKAFLTQDMDEYRTPYAKKAVQRPRRTSFCGTVNPGEYLIDDTGNRRFWTVSVNRIDLSRLFAITNDGKTQLWAQMAAEYQALPGSFRLSSDDRKLLENINVEHTRSLDFEDELRDLLNFDLDPALWGEFTSAQIATKLEAKPPANRLGRVLAKLAAEDRKISMRISRGQKYYRLPLVSNCAISAFPVEKNCGEA